MPSRSAADPPCRQVNLHDANRILSRNCELVSAAFDDHDAGDQPGIQIVFFRAGQDGQRKAGPVRFLNRIALQESINPMNLRAAGMNRFPFNAQMLD